nr:hypothetical protein GCM10020093_052550 [Planobispora longispora]
MALGAGFVALVLITVFAVFSSEEDVPRGQPMTIPPTQTAPTLSPPPVTQAWPRWGVTHTEYSADDELPEAVEVAGHLLARVPMVQNQHIMGWGAGNPEPAPGKYDFRDLDARVKLMSDSQGVPVITLCCAPDWMKGGSEGGPTGASPPWRPRRSARTSTTSRS